MKRQLRRIGKWILGGVCLITLAITAVYWWIEWSAQASIYETIESVPNQSVGLVLGTTPYVAAGRENLFFTTRMDAAAELYHTGKVKHLLVSGDNRHQNYNEPLAMQKALITRGVSPNDITLDYAGFRTLDSILRTRSVLWLE